jgi:peptide deformylase
MIKPLPLVYAPNEIFKKKALVVSTVDDEIRLTVDRMIKTLETEKAVGIGANMVGLLKRIVVVDLHENGVSNPQVFINPEIIYKSQELQTFEEASVCFPGIAAEISRPAIIKLKYLDYQGSMCTLEASGFLATVLQHEIDYLDGKIFLDYLSKMKSDMLLKKMQKYIKMHPPHVHSSNCRH